MAARSLIPVGANNRAKFLAAYQALPPAKQDRILAVAEAMIAGRGVREAAIAFLEAVGVDAPAVAADRILHNVAGVA